MFRREARLSRTAAGTSVRRLFIRTTSAASIAIGIPLAAGVFVNLFGWSLDPMFGAAAMSLSSFCVVSNALRLNFVKVHSPAHDRKIHHISNKHHKEEKSMEVTMKIEGMMCGHCEAAVKKALEALPTVESAEVSHEKGTAVVKLSAETPFETLKRQSRTKTTR